MSVRNNVNFILLTDQIGMQQVNQNNQKQDFCAPDGLTAKMYSKNGGADSSGNKADQHEKMHPQLVPCLCAAFVNPFYQINSQLADVIGAEGCRHRHFSCLPEGVILHGADEVYHHLADLVRGSLRDEREHDDREHLNEDEERVPADEPQALYRILRGENVGTFFEVMK